MQVEYTVHACYSIRIACPIGLAHMYHPSLYGGYEVGTTRLLCQVPVEFVSEKKNELATKFGSLKGLVTLWARSYWGET